MSGVFGSDDVSEIIKLILLGVIVIPFLGAMFSLIGSFNQPSCPTCDCSQYQSSLTQCQSLVSNLTQQINQTPVQYIQNITYIEVPVEKIVYKEKFVPLSINILALIFSVTITIKLFTIQLPKELEEKLKRIEKAIAFVKIGSLIVSFLIFIRVLLIFISLF